MRVSLRTKLFGGFGAVAALLLLLGVISLTQMSAINDDAKRLSANVIPALDAVAAVKVDARTLREHQLVHVATSDLAKMRELDGAIADDADRVAKGLKAYEPTIISAEDRALFDEVSRDWQAYLDASAPFAALSRAGKPQQAFGVLQAAEEESTKLAKTLDRWTTFNSDIADDVEQEAHASFAGARTLTLGLIAIALLIAVAAAWLITRGITRGVRSVLDTLTSLRDNCATDLDAGLRSFADGDLTRTVTPVTGALQARTNDEIGDVAQATNAIRERLVGAIGSYNDSRASLASMIQQVQGSAASVASSSEQMASTSEEAGRAVAEIASAVTEVAMGAQRQVETVESARTASEQVTAATAASAENAQETARAAEEARELAREGGVSVGKATDVMVAVQGASNDATAAIRQLGEKSEEIGGIVQTITGIAEQTNLLALNAAIEAARAGEQGRGFAVVAEEVRKLAEESQQAAASIASLIGEIQQETGRAVEVVETGAQRTAEGAATVAQAHAAFERIGTSVEGVTDRVAQIASAVQQISASAERMRDDMTEVSTVAESSSASAEEVSASTEQTSASTQEIAASAHQLATTAQELQELVARFKVA